MKNTRSILICGIDQKEKLDDRSVQIMSIIDLSLLLHKMNEGMNKLMRSWRQEMADLKRLVKQLKEKIQKMESSDLRSKYEELKKTHRRMAKDYNNLQVEHSRLLFDMEAVIEQEVKKKLENFYRKQ